MPLRIETFSNAAGGGNSFYKAVTHPLAARRAEALLRRLGAAGRLALYDPFGLLDGLAEIYDLATVLDPVAVFVQNAEAVSRPLLGRPAQPVSALPERAAAAGGLDALLVAAFDAERPIGQIRHLLPAGTAVASLDEMRLPDAMLGNPRRYLDPLNFATNFAFFRDGGEGGHRTRLTTANYWAGYGARGVSLWACLLDADGTALAEWREPLPEGGGEGAAAAAAVVIDSRAVRRRFGLPAFTGQLFLHVIGAAGHDVVKYALDTYGAAEGDGLLSCTHDANAWPAELYAGLPAPAPGERVLLWVQNSHPRPIPPGEVGLNPMGRPEAARWLDRAVPPFGSVALDVAALLPEARWPQQIEIRAGKHFVRPRYEVVSAAAAGGERRRIAHANVERADLAPDPRLPELGDLLGKGFLLPAPVLPPERWRTTLLPTPMATSQAELPLAAILYDASGREAARRRLGRLKRAACPAIAVGDWLAEAGAAFEGGFGHVELVSAAWPLARSS